MPTSLRAGSLALILHRWFSSPDGAQVRLVGNLVGVQIVDFEAVAIRKRDAAGILVEGQVPQLRTGAASQVHGCCPTLQWRGLGTACWRSCCSQLRHSRGQLDVSVCQMAWQTLSLAGPPLDTLNKLLCPPMCSDSTVWLAATCEIVGPPQYYNSFLPAPQSTQHLNKHLSSGMIATLDLCFDRLLAHACTHAC